MLDYLILRRIQKKCDAIPYIIFLTPYLAPVREVVTVSNSLKDKPLLYMLYDIPLVIEQLKKLQINKSRFTKLP